MSIINRLKNEGVLKLYHDYRSGTLRDLSGNSNHGSPSSTVERNGRGLSFPVNASSIVSVGASASLNITVGTIVVFGDFNDQTNNKRMYSKRSAAGSDYEFIYQTAGLYMSSSVLTASIVGKKYLAADFENGVPANFSIDGGALQAGTGNASVATNGASISIGNIYNFSLAAIQNTFKAVLAINRKLTSSEHAELYAELTSTNWPTQVYGKSNIDFQLKGSVNSVCTLNMDVQNNLIQDDSGAGNVATMVGMAQEKTIIGKVIGNNATASRYATTAVSATTSPLLADFSYQVAFKMNAAPGSLDYTIFGRGSATKRFRAMIETTGKLTTEALDDADNVSITSDQSVADGNWHLLTVSHDRDGNMYQYLDSLDTKSADMTSIGTIDTSLAIIIGALTSTLRAMDGSVKAFDLRLGELITEAEHDAAYARLKKAVQFKTDWGAYESYAAVTAGYLENTPFSVSTGSWTVDYETISGQTVKVLECTVAGRMAMKMSDFITAKEASYGEWEFYLYITNGAGTSYVSFVADRDAGGLGAFEGYQLQSRPGTYNNIRYEGIGVGGGLITLGVDDLSVGVWQKLKITRNVGGLFEVFINGVSKGTGTNTSYVDGSYFLCNFQAGTKIAYGAINGDYSITKRI